MQVHKKAKMWRTKPFPLYDDILPLVEGRHATGEGAFRVPEMRDHDIDDLRYGHDGHDLDNTQPNTEDDILASTIICNCYISYCSFHFSLTAQALLLPVRHKREPHLLPPTSLFQRAKRGFDHLDPQLFWMLLMLCAL